MKRLLLVLLLLLVACALFGQTQEYELFLVVGSRTGDEQYRDELLDEVLYELSLHREITVISASGESTIGNPALEEKPDFTLVINWTSPDFMDTRLASDPIVIPGA